MSNTTDPPGAPRTGAPAARANRDEERANRVARRRAVKALSVYRDALSRYDPRRRDGGPPQSPPSPVNRAPSRRPVSPGSPSEAGGRRPAPSPPPSPPEPERQPATERPREPANKGRSLPPELLTADEVRRLVHACPESEPAGLRNRALIAILYRGGLRLGEALALRPGDLDADASLLALEVRLPARRARHVSLDATAAALVGCWLETRNERGIDDAQLICTLRGTALEASYVRRLLPRLAHRAGIDKRVHAEGLRRTHAAELIAEELLPTETTRERAWEL